MSQVEKRRRHRSDDEIRQAVAEFAESGMGRQEFAALQGVSPTTLDNWRRKVGKLDEAKSQSRSRLVPVRVQSNAGNSESLEIRVNDRWAIRVSRGFDEETLRRLLEVLAKAC